MELSRLLTDLSHKEVRGRVEVDIAGLTQDSRQVQVGDLFVAIKGLDADGHDYIPHASAVVGNTFGAPLKNTAGPSLHILVRLQNIMSISLLPLFVEHGLNLFA